MLQCASSPHSETCPNAQGGKPQIEPISTQGELPQEWQWTLSFPAIIDSSELHEPGQVNCQELIEVHRTGATSIFIPFLIHIQIVQSKQF